MIYQMKRDEAIARRDAGIETAIKNERKEWFTQALDVIANLQPSNQFTGEQIRNIVTKKIGAPHHPNVWGALIRTAYTNGNLLFLNRYAQMRDPKSHGRMTPIYQVL